MMTSKIYPQHPRYKLNVSPTFENIISSNDIIKPSGKNVISSSSESKKITLWPIVLWIGLGALIFIALVMVVVIPIAALANTGNATVSTTTVSTICPTTSITSTVTSSSLPEQCINYTTITDSTRSPDYSASSSCDTATFTTTPIWVRFTGSGGTLMATCPMDENRCGTDFPGWYSGIHPSVAGFTTSGFVCFTYSGDFCETSMVILITNCNGFYVYFLKQTPYCNTRYCTI